ncbi:MAG: hypothetical protein IPJ34_06310 [Myxococcales bacterium]|nr:hypothetical protein [Myxococcales bacterium]
MKAVRPSPFLALLQRDEGHTRLDEICEFAPADGEDEERVLWLTDLVEWLRPARGERFAPRLRFLEARLRQQPASRAAVARTFERLVSRIEVERLLAYGGIPLDFHFFGAVREWLLLHTLPTACKTSDGASVLRIALAEGDLQWVGAPGLIAFFRGFVDAPLAESLSRALRGALTDLAHQLVAQAHAPNVRRLAAGDRSPFHGLYEAVATFDAAPTDDAGYLALRGRVRQCSLLLGAHGAELVERGASLNTTFQLRRMGEQLRRLDVLTTVRHDPSDEALAEALAAIAKDVVRGTNGRRLFTRSADLLAQNIVDSAAEVGRSYLDEERSSFRAAALAGAGGGAIMAGATIAKYALAALHLPALYEGVVFAVNYGAAFCAAYLLHFTIATKLPAHTAAVLARSVQGGAGHRARLRDFVTVFRSTVRLQIAGLFGNVVVAGPLALVADRGFRALAGRHLVSAHTAEHVLTSTSLLGPSFLFAGLTGVFLWVSSLVGAYGDNWTRAAALADRLATNRRVLRRIEPTRARAWADAVVGRVGGLAGNATLGLLLGLVPAAFVIAHVPVEIRHVTVSTSAVALALSQGVGTRAEVVLALSGLVVIGVVNVVVSFVLALFLALRASQGMRPAPASIALVRIGLGRWLRGRPV